MLYIISSIIKNMALLCAAIGNDGGRTEKCFDLRKMTMIFNTQKFGKHFFFPYSAQKSVTTGVRDFFFLAKSTMFFVVLFVVNTERVSRSEIISSKNEIMIICGEISHGSLMTYSSSQVQQKRNSTLLSHSFVPASRA